MTQCLVGQDVTNGQEQFAFARRLLQCQALTTFENAAASENRATLVTFKEVLKAVTLDAFPKKSLVTQHRYMRWFLCKPLIMSVKDYIARVVEINSYLTDFPPINATKAATMLSESKLVDLLYLVYQLGGRNQWSCTGLIYQMARSKIYPNFENV